MEMLKDLVNIKRNPLFDYYYIRTNTDFIVHNITSNKSYVERIENFQNNCSIDKSNLIEEFSIYFSIKITDFNFEYYEDEIIKAIYGDTSFDFVNQNNQFQISIYFVYKTLCLLFYSNLSQYSDKYFKIGQIEFF